MSAGKTKFPKFDNKKIVVFQNRIDLNNFRILNNFETEKLQQKFGLNKTDKVILFAGRISWEKGIDKLIDAVKKINSNNIKILIVGSTLHGENKVRKTKYIKKLEDKIHDLNSKIIFTGYISYEIMPVVYNLADIAVLPSMWEEPAGLTPLEAMACGTPVITTDSGGIPEYVGKSAVVLKRNTNLVSDIARNITNLLNDKELYELYRSEGLSRVQLYNSNNYAEELRKIL
ncbi:glycosyltransferase family 4 protein [Ligilactobacillus salivarius]|uniref:glycosyltransferase family 4 protein n=1 Tax=Ligilactobacillus salivarius TaxID=1624 RepID=UPI000A73745C|nr:glycosyltransferase family 4 protein [Ligilactobacillus salivarius]